MRKKKLKVRIVNPALEKGRLGFAALMFEARMKERLTVGELAKTINAAPATLMNIEAGRTSPGFGLMCQVADLLSIDLSRLLKEDTAKNLLKVRAEEKAKITNEMVAARQRLKDLRATLRGLTH